MDRPLPQLLGADGQPMAAVTSLTETTKEQRITLQGGDAGGMLYAEGASGKAVTMTSAMTLSTVWACVSRTAQAIAAMPLDVYARGRDGGREKDHGWLYELIAASPNADQTAIEYAEGKLSWLVATGNADSEIDRMNGRPVSLLPLPSNRVKPFRTAAGDLAYDFWDWDGKRRVIARDDMFHLRGWGFGGDEGLSAIRFGVQALGSALAADEASGKMFGSGMQASGVLKVNQKLNDAQRRQMQAQMEAYAGSTRAGKLMVLEAGMEFAALTLNPDDAQMLETRRFSVEEICRWFGVPPIVVGHAAQGQTMWGSGVEQIMLAWMQLGLNPLARKIEQRIRKQLIPAREQGRLYAEFNREAMLQMDSAAKAAFLTSMATTGTMTANERRAKLNMRRHEDPAADELFIQGAMVPMRLPPPSQG